MPQKCRISKERGQSVTGQQKFKDRYGPSLTKSLPAMPKERQHRIQTEAPKKRTITDEDEARLQQAKLDYELRRYPSIKATATANNVQYFTLRRRIQGLMVHCKGAHVQQQLLTNMEEQTLVDWMQYLALTRHPLNK